MTRRGVGGGGGLSMGDGRMWDRKRYDEYAERNAELARVQTNYNSLSCVKFYFITAEREREESQPDRQTEI